MANKIDTVRAIISLAKISDPRAKITLAGDKEPKLLSALNDADLAGIAKSDSYNIQTLHEICTTHIEIQNNTPTASQIALLFENAIRSATKRLNSPASAHDASVDFGTINGAIDQLIPELDTPINRTIIEHIRKALTHNGLNGKIDGMLATAESETEEKHKTVSALKHIKSFVSGNGIKPLKPPAPIVSALLKTLDKLSWERDAKTGEFKATLSKNEAIELEDRLKTHAQELGLTLGSESLLSEVGGDFATLRLTKEQAAAVGVGLRENKVMLGA